MKVSNQFNLLNLKITMKQIYVLKCGSNPLMYSTNFQAIHISIKNYFSNDPNSHVPAYTTLIGKARRGQDIIIRNEVGNMYVISTIKVYNKPQDLHQLFKQQ